MSSSSSSIELSKDLADVKSENLYEIALDKPATAIAIPVPPAAEKPEEEGPLKIFDYDDALYERFNFLPEWLLVLIECFIVSFIFVFPSLIVYASLKDFKRYDIFRKVSGRKGINMPSEFLRWSVFVAIFYSTFIISRFIGRKLPRIVHNTLAFFQVKMTDNVQDYLGYLYSVRDFISTMLFSVVLIYISNVIIFNFSAASSDDGIPWQVYIVRTIYAIFLIALLFMVQKLVLQFIGTYFRKKAFAGRIKESNLKTAIVKALDKAVSLNSLGNSKLFGLLGDQQISPYEQSIACGMNLASDSAGLVSEASAIASAKRVFNGLCPQGRAHLLPSDFKSYFREDEYEKIFTVISGSEADEAIRNEIDEPTMIQKFIDFYKLRDNLSKSLVDNGKVLSKLNGILVFFTLIACMIIVFPLYDVDMKLYISALFTSIFTFGWLFQDTIKDIYKSLVFLFAVHPYDVGDKVVIENENYTIQQIDLMSTVAIKWDGHVVYFPNGNLINKNIHNIRRSRYLSEKIQFGVNSRTPTDRLFSLRSRLTEFLKQDAKDFTGVMSMSGFDIVDETKMKIFFTVEHKNNFQESVGYYTRRNKFMTALKENAEQLGIEYFPSS